MNGTTHARAKDQLLPAIPNYSFKTPSRFILLRKTIHSPVELRVH
ncbi:MAG: hypothetical protein ACKO46_06680 [Alphaproteobacteria bacterium]